MSQRGRVGPFARALGFAGLLPQAAVVLAIGLVKAPYGPTFEAAAAAVHPLAILSFLGGAWWSLALRDEVDQAPLAGVAVLPGLAAVVLAFAAFYTFVNGGYGWILVVIGSIVIVTLLFDRWLALRGLAPEGWMSLRVPLSIGLGGLTIVAGALAGS